jgi:hypothetical protein
MGYMVPALACRQALSPALLPVGDLTTPLLMLLFPLIIWCLVPAVLSPYAAAVESFSSQIEKRFALPSRRGPSFALVVCRQALSHPLPPHSSPAFN